RNVTGVQTCALPIYVYSLYDRRVSMLLRRFLNWFVFLFLNAIALMAVDFLFDSFYIADFKTALLASLVLSVLNIFVKPFLFILSLPITIVTLGFFILILDAIILMISQSVIGDTFVIDGFLMAFVASIIISIISVILHKIVGDDK